MKLEDFENLVLGSGSDAWTHFACWGAGSGPSYKDKIAAWRGLQGAELSVEVESHSDLISLKDDLLVSIAWGIIQNDDFREDWANSFPNPKASSFYVDFFYSGNLVFREIVVSIDGGRCHLPMPEIIYDDKTHKAIRLIVSRKQYIFNKTLNAITSNCDFDSYINRARIEIEDRNWMV